MCMEAGMDSFVAAWMWLAVKIWLFMFTILILVKLNKIIRLLETS